MRHKYIIFSDNTACDNLYNFFESEPITDYQHPYLISQAGCGATLAEADLIILEDADLANNKMLFESSYTVLQELLTADLPTRIVYHQPDLQIGSEVDDEVIEKLRALPFLQQSHIAGSIYDIELRAVEKALAANDHTAYDLALTSLDERRFIDPKLEALDRHLFNLLYSQQENADIRSAQAQRDQYLINTAT